MALRTEIRGAFLLKREKLWIYKDKIWAEMDIESKKTKIYNTKM